MTTVLDKARQKAWKTTKADGVMAAYIKFRGRGQPMADAVNQLGMRLTRLANQQTANGARLQKVDRWEDFEAQVAQLEQAGAIPPGKNGDSFRPHGEIYRNVHIFSRAPWESSPVFCFILKEGSGRLKEFLIAQDDERGRTQALRTWIQDSPTDDFRMTS